MAFNTIKGLTVEIGGDTTKLGAALENINKKSTALSKELREIDQGLKFNPGNAELLAQKQKVLAETVANTAKKLETLKEAERQVQEQFARGEVSEEQVRALQREIVTTESKLQKFEREAEDAADAVDKLGEESEDAGDAADKAAEGFDTASIAVGSFIGGLALDVLREAVSKLKDMAASVVETGLAFSSSMSEVGAISGATGEELAMLEETARKYGATTTFSASEAADALKYMALAGWDVQQSTDGLPGILSLAASSGMDLAAASDMVTDYLSAFGLEASDSARFADMLAYAQSNANTTAEGLGEAYKNSAALLNAAGQDVETVTSLLSMMANQGLKGSEAGTALSAVMRDITAKMKDGSIAIGDTVVSVTDANGNFRDLTDILLDVESATNGMGDAERAAALSATFTADSTKGLNLLLNAGVDSAAAFEEQLRKSSGTADKMAETMNDNLGGDLKEMSSAFEELSLKIYDKVEPALRSVVAFVTGSLVPALETLLNNLPTVGVVLGGLTAAFVAFKVTALGGLPAVIGSVKVALTGLFTVLSANPIGLVIIAITALVAAFTYLWKNSEAFREFWINLWAKIKTAALNAADGLKKLPDKIYNSIKDAVKRVQKWGTDMVEKAKSSATTMLNTTVSILKNLPANILSAIKGAIANVTSWGRDMASRAKTSASDMLNNVVGILKGLPGKVLSSISGALSTVSKWGTDMASRAKSGMSNVVSTVTSTLKSLPSKVLSIGGDLVSGLWNGINNKLSWLKSKISSFTSSVLDSIKGFFGVNSPSKETAWIGEMLDQGLAKGLADNATAPVRAMQRVSGSVLDAAGSVDGLSLERQLSRPSTFGAAPVAADSTLATKLDKILAAIERGQVLTIDGAQFVGATASRYDATLGQRRALAARGAV